MPSTRDWCGVCLAQAAKPNLDLLSACTMHMVAVEASYTHQQPVQCPRHSNPAAVQIDANVNINFMNNSNNNNTINNVQSNSFSRTGPRATAVEGAQQHDGV